MSVMKDRPMVSVWRIVQYVWFNVEVTGILLTYSHTECFKYTMSAGLGFKIIYRLSFIDYRKARKSKFYD